MLPIICHSNSITAPPRSFVRGKNFHALLDDDEKFPELLKETLTDSEEELILGVSTFDLELSEHKPLGCTVEESLAPEPDASTPVFVAKVVEGGHAEKAGIEVGDVILGVSGVFDEVEDVSNADLDRVRSLVSGRHSNKPLTIRVIRGTDVISRHESHLVSLCTLPGETDYALDDCITSLMKEGDLDEVMDGENIGMDMDCDEEGECMLDAMFAAWGLEDDDASSASGASLEKDDTKPQEAQKTNSRPWASRSSPSGTYVRDPVTGQMENISE